MENLDTLSLEIMGMMSQCQSEDDWGAVEDRFKELPKSDALALINHIEERRSAIHNSNPKFANMHQRVLDIKSEIEKRD